VEEIEVRVKGQIDRNWSAWLAGLTIAYTENGDTTLTGAVRDQSALLGLMDRLSRLGLHILSVASTEKSPREKQGGAENVSASG
jgi:hypothetical protein